MGFGWNAGHLRTQRWVRVRVFAFAAQLPNRIGSGLGFSPLVKGIQKQMYMGGGEVRGTCLLMVLNRGVEALPARVEGRGMQAM